jgi:hypothetical protein
MKHPTDLKPLPSGSAFAGPVSGAPRPASRSRNTFCGPIYSDSTLLNMKNRTSTKTSATPLLHSLALFPSVPCSPALALAVGTRVDALMGCQDPPATGSRLNPDRVGSNRFKPDKAINWGGSSLSCGVPPGGHRVSAIAFCRGYGCRPVTLCAPGIQPRLLGSLTGARRRVK